MTDARAPRICRMLDDPELSGDLLLVGLAFARFLDYGGLPAGQKMSTAHVSDCCWPGKQTRTRSEPHRLRAVGTVMVAETPPACDGCGKPLRAEVMAGGWCGEQCFLRWNQTRAVLPAQHNLPGSWVQTTAGDARKAS